MRNKRNKQEQEIGKKRRKKKEQAIFGIESEMAERTLERMK